jgi:hypothetical protein
VFEAGVRQKLGMVQISQGVDLIITHILIIHNVIRF